MDENLFEALGVEIPKYDENMQLPDPKLQMYYRNLGDRIVWVEGEIDDGVTEITKMIHRWNLEDKGIPAEERKPIRIILHTGGGNVDSGLCLCDAMLASTTPVWTINCGWAMSCGSLILACGSKRFCTRNSVAMIHSISGGSAGTMQQIKDSTQFAERLDAMVKKIMLERTEITPRAMNSKKKDDWYLFAEDQIKYGVVHKIIDTIDEVI